MLSGSTVNATKRQQSLWIYGRGSSLIKYGLWKYLLFVYIYTNVGFVCIFQSLGNNIFTVLSNGPVNSAIAPPCVCNLWKPMVFQSANKVFSFLSGAAEQEQSVRQCVLWGWQRVCCHWEGRAQLSVYRGEWCGVLQLNITAIEERKRNKDFF